MAQLNHLEENRRFALTFNHRIEEPRDLFRYGDVNRPIRPLRWLPQNQVNGQRTDFLIDEDGYVITEESTGNFCSQCAINNMKDQSNFEHRFYPFIGMPLRAYPANTAVSPCSSPLGTIRQEERLRLSDRNSGSHGVPNVNLFDFMFLLVDYGKVLCSTANELQQYSDVFSKEEFIPAILTVL